MEQRWNARAGEKGDPRENPPTSGFEWHDYHVGKSKSWESNPVHITINNQPSDSHFGPRDWDRVGFVLVSSPHERYDLAVCTRDKRRAGNNELGKKQRRNAGAEGDLENPEKTHCNTRL
ncbi:hypothetical protein PR048_020794 [Dryococelus australis]|uniref:Uncharacterized protein n=1 Tax=Dryococelus australis TaxID=614101 RepID=A0ABQ9GWF1_9NEOP|nr:hypothetical protein PR048_020794 [Dryococelus australis]